MFSSTIKHCLLLVLLQGSLAVAKEPNTLPPLKGDVAPQNYEEMWAGFDPRAEPLEVETLHEWEEEGVVLRIVRFRIGVFKGEKAKLAAIYGFPKEATKDGKLPGLLQIHGGGQYADHKACLMNAKRGYATVSIAWAGRISAPNYRVGPNEVKLFWEGKTEDPAYKVTTDWGAVDGYHAPSRHPKNNFPSANAAPWTIDPIESPRNSPWFLCALAARRALTFLEVQPEVNADKLGVYGHSMGGKLTVMTSPDPRVKAAAPSCGGISDRGNDSELFRRTVGDDVSLKEISCPIIFLSPANDFHGRICDLPRAIHELENGDIKNTVWRVTCSPHRNHQDTAEYEVATLLWFDHHLKGTFEFPKTPEVELQVASNSGTPWIAIRPDASKEIVSVDFFYTQGGKQEETRFDRDITVNRFWRHAEAMHSEDETQNQWSAKLPLTTLEKPLWVYANVLYRLKKPVAGAGYYYGIYNAKTFNVSTLLKKVSPQELKAAGAVANTDRSLVIETFEEDWEKEWFHYSRDTWQRTTHKIFDDQFLAPKGAKLAFSVRSEEVNQLVVTVDQHAAVVDITKPGEWQEFVLTTEDFRNFAEEALPSWQGVKELKLTDAHRLRSTKRGSKESRIVGRNWRGSWPQFRNLRWVTDE